MCTKVWPVTPEIEEMLTIAPPLAFCITGITARMPRNTPLALMLICRSQVAMLSRSGSLPLTPALLMRMSILP